MLNEVVLGSMPSTDTYETGRVQRNEWSPFRLLRVEAHDVQVVAGTDVQDESFHLLLRPDEPIDPEVEFLLTHVRGIGVPQDSNSGIWKRSSPTTVTPMRRESRSVPPPPMKYTFTIGPSRPVEERGKRRLVRFRRIQDQHVLA